MVWSNISQLDGFCSTGLRLQCLETFLIITLLEDATVIQWMEARDAAKDQPPTTFSDLAQNVNSAMDEKL